MVATGMNISKTRLSGHRLAGVAEGDGTGENEGENIKTTGYGLLEGGETSVGRRRAICASRRMVKNWRRRCVVAYCRAIRHRKQTARRSIGCVAWRSRRLKIFVSKTTSYRHLTLLHPRVAKATSLLRRRARRTRAYAL